MYHFSQKDAIFLCYFAWFTLSHLYNPSIEIVFLDKISGTIYNTISFNMKSADLVEPTSKNKGGSLLWSWKKLWHWHWLPSYLFPRWPAAARMTGPHRERTIIKSRQRKTKKKSRTKKREERREEWLTALHSPWRRPWPLPLWQAWTGTIPWRTILPCRKPWRIPMSR